MLQERLFDVPVAERPPQHYALLLRATGGSYGRLDRDARARLGRLSSRLIMNGVTEDALTDEGTRLRAALGRAPTAAEVAERLLG